MPKKPNIFFICMDSIGYDNYVSAHTPNMDSVGKLQRLHSAACWTVPSITSYLWNRPPIGLDNCLFPPYKYTQPVYVPKYYSNEGYYNILLTSNAYIDLYDRRMNKGISQWFNHWEILRYLKDKQHATKPIIRDSVKLLREGKGPIFLFLLLMDTHHPYYDGKNIFPRNSRTPHKNVEAQIRAAEYIDREIKPLLDAIKTNYRNNIVYITADHGDDPTYGHDPVRTLFYNESLFAIPFIKGENISE